MSILDVLFFTGGARQAAALSSELAQRCCASVWDRVNPRVLEMGASEARGYLRAWATEAVNGRLDAAALRQRGIPAAARATIATQAVDGIVERLLDEVLRIQRTRHIRRRAA